MAKSTNVRRRRRTNDETSNSRLARLEKAVQSLKLDRVTTRGGAGALGVGDVYYNNGPNTSGPDKRYDGPTESCRIDPPSSEYGTVTTQVHRARKAVEELHERLQHLEDRLGVALSSTPPARTDSAAVTPSANSPLADQIASIASMLEGAAARVVSVRDRVDV